MFVSMCPCVCLFVRVCALACVRACARACDRLPRATEGFCAIACAFSRPPARTKLDHERTQTRARFLYPEVLRDLPRSSSCRRHRQHGQVRDGKGHVSFNIGICYVYVYLYVYVCTRYTY